MNTIFTFFDVGGVVIKDFSTSDKWQELKQALGVTPANTEGFDQIWQQHQSRICVDFDVDALVPILNKELHLKLSPNFSILNEFINRFEANEYIQSVLTAATQKGGVGLLTNMYPRMLQKITESNLLPTFTFQLIIDSSEVGLQKPDSNIFMLAEKLSGVEGAQILFVDNTQIHLDAAKERGWQTYFFDSSDYQKSSKDLWAFIEQS